MTRFTRLPAAVLALLAGASACVTGPDARPVAHNVEFLRGCWVSKTEPGGAITGFLRLLPDREDGRSFVGAIQSVHGAMVRDRFQLSFARDGSRAAIGYLDQGLGVFAAIAGPSSAWPRAVFADAAGEDGGARLIAEAGEEDTLHITRTGGRQPAGELFRGERDGCD